MNDGAGEREYDGALVVGDDREPRCECGIVEVQLMAHLKATLMDFV